MDRNSAFIVGIYLACNVCGYRIEKQDYLIPVTKLHLNKTLYCPSCKSVVLLELRGQFTYTVQIVVDDEDDNEEGCVYCDR